MYRFNLAVRLFTTKCFSHPSALIASRRCHSGSVGQKVLPPEFSTNVVRLTCQPTAEGGVCDVYVVGVTHGYSKSLQEVKSVVNFVKPQAVFLELCRDRAAILFPDKVMTWRLGPLFVKLCYTAESEFGVAFEEANKLGVKVIHGDIDRPLKVKTWRLGPLSYEVSYKLEVGSEFRVAFEEANKFGAKVILGDLPIKITNRKLDDNFTMNWPIIKKRDSILREPKPENWKDDPIIVKILRDERDQYMSIGLLEVARKHKSVVAVVGKNHLLGIQKYWKQTIEVERIRSLPLVAYRYRVIVGVISVATCIYATLLYLLYFIIMSP